MRVFTQSNLNHTMPSDATWMPCVCTQAVAHVAAAVQPLLITHIAAVQHYQHSLMQLCLQQIVCVGRHTAEKLRQRGFKKIRCYLRAADIEIHAPITWLCGDHHARNFAEDPQVTTIQTYRSTLHTDNIQTLLQMNPQHIHVYSAAVLAQLQTRTWPHTQLHTVPSAPAQKNLWRSVCEFDPNLPQDAAQALKQLMH